MDMEVVIEGTLPHMTIEGEVKEWIPAPNGGHIGIVISDQGGVYTIKSESFGNPSDLPSVVPGRRVRFRYESFRNEDGERISGKDAESGATYPTGGARDIELLPFDEFFKL